MKPIAFANVLLAGLLLTGATALAQNTQPEPQITRTDLVRADAHVEGQELLQVRVDIPEGVLAPMHVHPGDEVAYVLQGTFEYRLGDAAPVTLHAGQSLFIPAGTPHSAKNTGDGTASELATYVVEKGKPLVVLRK
jgi:quercetin dioxygenase-like cupin family protein